MARKHSIRNIEHYRAVVELRRSNAATPIPSGRRYRRRPKHRDRPVGE